MKEENYYEPVRIGNKISNNYIEYGSKGDTNKTHLKGFFCEKIIPKRYHDLKKPDSWKIHLTIKVNFRSSKDTH